jgi:hypothetical protein
MGTGHIEDTTDSLHKTQDGNWVKAFLQAPVVKTPGTHFLYNSGATYMLSAIIRQVSGQDLLEYLQPRLLEPLGIEGATWETCPRGLSIGGWGLNITTEDIAKFGQLYLNKGVWDGRRILEESWIEEATSKQISNGDGGANDWAQGYGYQFWRCQHGAYRGDGAFGQFCIVMPEQDAVLAITSASNDMQAVMNAVWEHLLAAMKPHSIAEDKEGLSLLSVLLKGLSLNPPQLQSSSPREGTNSGGTYQLEDNEAKWKSCSIQFEKDEAITVLLNDKGEEVTRFGRESWVEGVSRLIDGTETRVMSSFTWQDPNTIQLTQRFIETPFYTTSTISFEESDILLTSKINVSFAQAESPPIRGRLS